MARSVLFNYVIIFVGCLWLAGCATPSENFSAIADEFGFYSLSAKTNLFEHQIYINPEANNGLNKDVLHVYLDGDGTPWEHSRWVARDPTSRNPMILELMKIDKQPAILLGRPCYHGFNKAPQCDYRYWTSHRYSLEVVDSMATALNIWLQEHAYSKLSLIGFSGGGTLALLIAPKITSVETIVTLAANLDVAEWSRYHGYGPLQNSLNPADQLMIADIQQIHIAGADDKVVPPIIIESYLEKQKKSSIYIVYENFDHDCCWVDQWAEILKFF